MALSDRRRIDRGVSQNWGYHFWGVSVIRTIVFGVYIGVPYLGKLPYQDLRGQRVLFSRFLDEALLVAKGTLRLDCSLRFFGWRVGGSQLNLARAEGMWARDKSLTYNILDVAAVVGP